MINFSEWAYNYLNWELPTSKSLWTPKQGLQTLIEPDGYIKQISSVNPILPITAQRKREILFETMQVNDVIKINGRYVKVQDEINRKVDKMLSNKKRYENISHKFANPIRWYHIAMIHEMECTQNFNCYLGNGQRWNKKTTIVPIGRGPFKSFELGALDAIHYDKLDLVKDWSIGNTLYLLEGFNGYGYELYRGINSPYLWSGSNHYTAGKYVTDRVYSKTARSEQIGIALLYKEILKAA